MPAYSRLAVWLRHSTARLLLSVLGALAATFATSLPAWAVTILLVTDGDGPLTSNESSYKSHLESLGYAVTTVWDGASQGAIDSAWAAAHVVYVPYSVSDLELGDKLRLCTKGIVFEERLVDDNLGLSTQPGWETSSYTSITITDNTHYITSPFNTGSLTIFTSSQPMTLMNPTHAAGLRTLAEQHSGNKALAVVEAGAPLANTVSGNSMAAGRRVHLPWGGNAFNIAALNANAQTLALRAIQWCIGDDRLLHLKLNETSGTTAADSSVYERHGTVTGAANWVAARRHNGFDFNGSTKIEVNSLLGNPGSFTVACWARIDAADSSGAEGVSLGNYVVLRLHDGASGRPAGLFFAGGSTWRSVTAASSYIGRGWHHFAVTFDDAANSLKLWIDGVNVATTSTTSSVTWSGQGTTTRVGQHGHTGTTWDLDGAVDDVRVYNRALSQSEMADLYGLVGHWKLDEAAGGVAADSSGRSLHGTYANTPSLAQPGPYPGEGQYAVAFDGNDYVEGPAATSYNLEDGFSIAAWVYLNNYVDGAAILQNGSTSDNCQLAISASGQVRIAGRSSGGLVTHTTTARLSLATWTHVVGTYDGFAFRVYVDGVLSSTGHNPFTATTPAGNLTLAASLEGADQFLPGRLRDVRFYNRAIGADDAADLYGLTGYWKLDESAGAAAVDSSGYGNDGTYTGAPALGKPGVYARSTGFGDSGTSDRLTLGHRAIERSRSVSASFWIKTVHAGEQAMLSGNNGSQDNEFLLHFFNATTFRTYFHGAMTTWTTPNVANGRWHHLVVVADNTTGLTTAYFDGASLGAKSAGAGATPFNIAPGGLITGQEQDSVGGSFDPNQRMRGDLDELRIYNRPLAMSEIADLYGLIGHWKFDESGGVAAADSSPHARHATFTSGAPQWISTGVYANALEFNGANDATTMALVTPPVDGTVAFWFRSDGPPAARQRPWGLDTNFEVWQDPDGLLSCDLNTDGFQGGCITTTPLHTAGRWYHVAITFDSADDSYAIYLDGQLHRSGVSTWGTSQAPAGQLAFGSRSGTTDRFDGALDDFRIYNRKLSAPEIYDVFGLKAWYKFDETSGAVASDSTGLLHHGVYAGSPALGVAANGAASQGTAVAFNGSNSVQVTGLYGRTPSVSVAAWVRLDAVDSAGAEVISLGDHFRLRLSSGASGAAATYHNGSAYVTATANHYILGTGWHHFAAALRAGDALKLYIDGVEAASMPVNGPISYAGLGANTRIATHGNGGTTVDLSGRIDDMRVYDRAVKPEEVYQLYRGSRINGIKIIKWMESR